MKIVVSKGGLGNQIYQYIFLRYLEEVTKDNALFDDTFFFRGIIHHQGYELERAFGIKLKRLSEYFNAQEWEEIVRATTLERKLPMFSLLQQIGVIRHGALLFSEEDEVAYDTCIGYEKPYTGNYIKIPYAFFTDEVGKIQGDVYYDGYWTNISWFDPIQDTIRKELTFVPIKDDNKYLAEKILNGNSVAVHVRRGDYLALGWDLGMEYYVDAVTSMKEHVEDPVFFIFSDDLAFCNERLNEMGLYKGKDKIILVDGNTGINSFRDMQLMSLCKNMILANSTFSVTAAMLNQNPNKYIVESSNMNAPPYVGGNFSKAGKHEKNRKGIEGGRGGQLWPKY
ncbi:alpha-1,2-fucosyltransferase [Lachnospiraceae bacterium ZAX-1]